MTRILYILSVLTFISCSQQDEKKTFSNLVPLTGKIYGMTDPPSDTTQCGEILPLNAELPYLLFINDSIFVHVLPGNCGDGTENFACIKYYSGKYIVDNDALVLNFAPKMAASYLKSANVLTAFSQEEDSDRKTERLVRRDCKSFTSFEMCDVQSHLMSQRSGSFDNKINSMKSEKIWEILFRN